MSHKALILLAFLAATLGGSALATPRMSLTAGTPCTACHFNPSGGEGRTEIGFGAMHKVGLLSLDYLPSSNYLLDGLVGLSFDYRGQGARLGRPELVDTADGGTETQVPDFMFFPMQVQPYLAVMPLAGLTLYGTWLMGPEIKEGELCDPVFPGMSCFGAQAIYELGGHLPTVRAGVFQPSIGVRHDDHTIMTRGDALNRRVPVIPPGYAEAGGEVAWQPRQWVRIEGGAFHTGNLDRALNDGAETAELWPVAWHGRLTFQPLFEFGGGEKPKEVDEFDFDAPTAEAAHPFIMNTWLGVSGYGSGDFRLINAFLGLGIHEGLALLSEVAVSQRTVEHDTFNALLSLSYSPWAWLAGTLRAERASTTTATDDATVWQYVATLEFFPIPGMEIRPEYRLVETDEYRFGQATLQLHLFY